MALLFLPDPGQWATTALPESPVTPRDTLNASASTAAEQQLTLAAENAPLRILYGQVRIGPQVAQVLGYNGALVILAVWGHGEVDSFVDLQLDDQALPAGVTYTHHVGTVGQTVDTTLVAAYAAQSPPVTYTDTLPGICYSVVTVPAGASAGFPRLAATIKGRKVLDARENLLTNSDTTTGWLNATASLVAGAILGRDGIRVTYTAASGDAPHKNTALSHSPGVYTASVLVDLATSSDTSAPFGVTFLGFDVDGVSYVQLFFNQTTKLITSTAGVLNATYVSASATLVSGTVWRFVITGSFAKTCTPLSLYAYVGADTKAITIGWPQIQAGAIATGYQPTGAAVVTAGTRWSDNPALCLSDFITDTTYGMGKAVDQASVTSVAYDCDTPAGGVEKLRTLNLALDTVQSAQAWVDTLKVYAGCWVVPSASGLKLVSDKAGSSIASYAHASGQILSLINLKKRGVQNTPTVLTVTYRDTSITPHRDGTATVYAAGVLAGTTPRRESQVSLPGITRYSQAYREATERLNKLLLNDLSFTLAVFDEGLSIEVGDIVDVTHPLGLTAKAMRVMGVSGEYGRYAFALVEYDPAVYASTVATAPTFTDTSLPNPSAPPALGSVTMVEEVFQLENGTFSSRWRVTWAASTFAYLARYRAELYVGSTLIHASSPDTNQWATPAVQENIAYTVKVAVVSSIGSTGAWSTQNATAQGKQLVPSNVPSISAFEAGGRVYASWLPAVDIDIWRYEVRYGAVGGSWAAATLLDRVDALRLISDQIPAGSWTLHVKALDSVQQYSSAAATVNVTVTSDINSFLISAYDQTAPTLTNMQEYAGARDDTSRYFITEDNVAFGTKFSSALSTYTNPLASYHSSVTSTWLGEAEDYGLLLGGQWTGTANVADVSGTHVSYFGSSPDGTTWTYNAGLSQKLNARFARLKHEATTTSTLQVVIPTQSIRLDAIPREEVGTGTSSAAGPVTITLANAYVAIKKLTITLQGTTARSATFDNVVLGATTTFDVYVFNDAGVKIASAFQYDFQGV